LFGTYVRDGELLAFEAAYGASSELSKAPEVGVIFSF
jgi:hypothetical protein